MSLNIKKMIEELKLDFLLNEYPLEIQLGKQQIKMNSKY